MARRGLLLLAGLGLATTLGLLPTQDALAVPSPTINVSDATPFPVTEGNTGTTAVTFNVTLDASPDSNVSVSFATMYGNATAGSDYVYQESTLSWSAGATGAGLTKTITVLVNGDAT